MTATLTNNNDVKVLRALARQVAAIAAKPVQNERRELWRKHNSLERTRPLVIIGSYMPFFHEVLPWDKLECSDPSARELEWLLQQLVWRDRLNDDSIIEPFITVPPVRASLSGEERWGAPIRFIHSTENRGAGIYAPPIKNEEDIEKLLPQPHLIDEAASAERLRKVQDAIGDIIDVHPDRSPMYSGQGRADMSTDTARLIGLEQFMLYMIDRPEWLHRFQSIVRDGVLRQHQQAEEAGDWRLFNHHNQAMCYCRELAGPGEHFNPVQRKDLWTFSASQETTLVSPAMFDEFVLEYQLPIISRFGLSAYGCCEDLTRKIHLLRKIPNLRRISVTPWADVAKCAEQIGNNYILSWRPSPAEMICMGFDPERARRLLREGLNACKDCHADITLKDVETINGRFDDLVEWVRIAKEVAEEFA
ncbi:MAG TPA: hypothetical protein ENN09_06360 [Planctomycetes bacterium]|nr:hypothetical protein [Planctomycetota bacterium]